jgi:uncharacterized membrane protein YqjE
MAAQHMPDAYSAGVPPAERQAEPQVRDLLKQLAADSTELVRGEVALAKLEMRDTARELAVDSAKLGIAIGIALSGGLILLAAIVIGFGHLLGERFGLAALIVGTILLLGGGLLARAGIRGLSETSVKPEQTVRSLERDRRWAKEEVKELKEELTS